MSTIIRICDSTMNKYSGFELAKNENIIKLFPNGVEVGDNFTIGEYKYKVVRLYIDGFYKASTVRGEPVIDDLQAKIGTHVWIACETKDPRIIEGSSEHPKHESILSDLESM